MEIVDLSVHSLPVRGLRNWGLNLQLSWWHSLKFKVHLTEMLTF